MRDGLHRLMKLRPLWRSAPSAFDKGLRAANCNAEKADNPYPRGCTAHSDWDAGFETAKDSREAAQLDGDA